MPDRLQNIVIGETSKMVKSYTELRRQFFALHTRLLVTKSLAQKKNMGDRLLAMAKKLEQLKGGMPPDLIIKL